MDYHLGVQPMRIGIVPSKSILPDVNVSLQYGLPTYQALLRYLFVRELLPG